MQKGLDDVDGLQKMALVSSGVEGGASESGARTFARLRGKGKLGRDMKGCGDHRAWAPSEVVEGLAVTWV